MKKHILIFILVRKNSMLIGNALVLTSSIGAIICKPLNSYIPLIISRAILGLATGLFGAIVPIYMTEIAPKNMRGIFNTINQTSLVFGILFTNVLGLPQLLGSNKNWPYLLGATSNNLFF
jgi:MFS family permease